MEHILKNIRDLAGVHGTFVFDSSGNILTHSAHAVYDVSLLGQVSQVLVKALDTMQLHYKTWENLTVKYSDGWVLVRSVGQAPAGSTVSGLVFLAVIADGSLNLSFVNVALRVAAGKVKSALQGGPADWSGSGSMPRNSAPGFAPSGSGFDHNPGSAPAVVPASSSAMSWSGAGSSMAGRSGVAVVDEQASAFLSVCSRALAEHVGPMAKVFVKEAVRKLLGTAPFGAPHAKALVGELEKHITDAQGRAVFHKKVGI